MASRITYQTGEIRDGYTVEIGRRGTGRQSGDVCISRNLAIDCPLKLAALVRADGSVDEWYAEWGSGDNTYWHLDHGSADAATGKYGMGRDLTPAQRETLVRIWGGEVRPFGVRGTCGATVMRWMSPSRDEVAAILGRVPALTARCDDREEIRGGADLPDDEIAAREAYLEQAVEEGQIGGAAAVDI